MPSANYSVNVAGKTIALKSGTTEIDLSGLRGLNEVSYSKFGGNAQYETDYRLVIEGTLSHDPDTESITFGDTITGQSIRIASGGTYNCGKQSSQFGHTVTSTGTGLIITQSLNSNYNAPVFDIQSGGSFNWLGGVINSKGTFYFRKDAVINITNGEINITNEWANYFVHLRLN